MFEEINSGRRLPDTAVLPANSRGTVLITGASSGIGAIYADRFARRGHDLILVARDRDRLAALASRLTDNTRRSVKVLVADLNDPADLSRVENVLRTDSTIAVLVNNVGVDAPRSFPNSDIGQLGQTVDLNVIALVSLAYAVVPAFVNRGKGAIINVVSIIGLVPGDSNDVSADHQVFMLACSQCLQREFAGRGVRVQAVLPGAQPTEFWELSGPPWEHLVLTADDLVDAALADFDRGELVSIPPLPEIAGREAFEAARQKLTPNLSLSSPAMRYGAACVITDLEGLAGGGYHHPAGPWGLV